MLMLMLMLVLVLLRQRAAAGRHPERWHLPVSAAAAWACVPSLQPRQRVSKRCGLKEMEGSSGASGVLLCFAQPVNGQGWDGALALGPLALGYDI